MKKRRAMNMKTGQNGSGDAEQPIEAAETTANAAADGSFTSEEREKADISSDKGQKSDSEAAKEGSNKEELGDIPPMTAEDGPGGNYGVDYVYGGPFDEVEAMEQFMVADGDYAALPHPELFNAYPPEVQRKIMEWTDRDVKARRDDESRRQDELMRAKVERDRRTQTIPAIVIVLSLVCAAVTGIITRNPLFSVAFLLVPLAIIAARFTSSRRPKNKGEVYLRK